MTISYIIMSEILNIPPFPILYKVKEHFLCTPLLSLFLSFFFYGFSFFFFVLMVALSGAILFEADFKLLGDAYGLSLADGVEFPSLKSMILSPPPCKVGIYLKTLDAGLRLPLSDFQVEIL